MRIVAAERPADQAPGQTRSTQSPPQQGCSHGLTQATSGVGRRVRGQVTRVLFSVWYDRCCAYLTCAARVQDYCSPQMGVPEAKEHNLIDDKFEATIDDAADFEILEDVVQPEIWSALPSVIVSLHW